MIMQIELITMTNIISAPAIGLIMILIDYHNNRAADTVQKRIFSLLIVTVFAAMMCDLIYAAVGGVPTPLLCNVNRVASCLYFLLLSVSFGLMFLFLEYSSIGTRRLKKVTAALGALIGVYAFVLVLGAATGKIFYITSENLYSRGDLYAIVIIFPYLLVTLAVTNVILNRKHMNRIHFALLLISVLPAGVGSTLDILNADSQKIWPCIFMTVLFCYLFIIRMTALIDSLTGVYNRRGCDEHLIAIGKMNRRKQYSVVVIDMDDFKKINDTFGHAQGDNALRDATNLLRASVRRSDFLARYGGDEFIIFAPSDEPGTIVSHIKSKIEEFNARGIRPYTLSLSCGGAIYMPGDPRTPQEFIAYVDTLMYFDKDRRK
jgi:diguanylate cyclase (GGDEF)-like protein